MVAYETALIEKWKQVRGGEDTTLIPAILNRDPTMRVLVQMAFEAGREWQTKHPTASIEFPDYDAPEVGAK